MLVDDMVHIASELPFFEQEPGGGNDFGVDITYEIDVDTNSINK